MMKNFKKMARNIMDTRKSYNEELFATIQQVLPDYEKNILLEYTNGNNSKLIMDQNEFVMTVKDGVAKQDFNQLL